MVRVRVRVSLVFLWFFVVRGLWSLSYTFVFASSSHLSSSLCLDVPLCLFLPFVGLLVPLPLLFVSFCLCPPLSFSLCLCLDLSLFVFIQGLL